MLADDELPSGRYAIRVRGFSSGGGFVDIAPIQVVNHSLPDFQVSTGAVTSNELDPGHVITMGVTARNRGDGFSLDLPVFEVVMEVGGVESLLYQIHADARGDIVASQSFTSRSKRLRCRAPTDPYAHQSAGRRAAARE